VTAREVGAPGASTGATLARRLGPYDAAAIVISNVVGGGIFFIPVIVAGLVPSGWAMLGGWLVGGVLAFAGAMAYAELATLRPHAGGEYVYLRDAFGPLAAFLTGWTSFVAGFSGAIAAGTVALAGYLGRFIPAAADQTPLLTLPLPYVPLVVSPQALVAVGAIFTLSLVHLHGSGRLVHNLLAAVKMLAIAVFIALGLSVGRGSLANVGGAHAVAAPVTGWLLALIPIMFAYSGWNAASYVAEEIRDPNRNVPRALGFGTLAVIGVYCALNLLYLYAVPIGDLASLPSGRLTDIVAERLFGFAAGNIIAVFTIVGIAASVSAMVLTGPRIYYAMARDGVFLASAGRVHPRFRTPMLAIVAQAVWSSVLVLSGTLSQLVAYTGFSVVLFSGIAVVALFVLRRRDPRGERPFRALGYPVAPALFVVASFVMVVNEIWNNPGTSLAGLAVIAAGLPLYHVLGRQRRAALTPPAPALVRQASATSVAAASVPSLAANSRNDAGEPLR
jgi:APA family basic amino acid/polyamine antiporter